MSAKSKVRCVYHFHHRCVGVEGIEPTRVVRHGIYSPTRLLSGLHPDNKSSRDGTWTRNILVMSQMSYLLLYPAISYKNIVG